MVKWKLCGGNPAWFWGCTFTSLYHLSFFPNLNAPLVLRTAQPQGPPCSLSCMSITRKLDETRTTFSFQVGLILCSAAHLQTFWPVSSMTWSPDSDFLLFVCSLPVFMCDFQQQPDSLTWINKKCASCFFSSFFPPEGTIITQFSILYFLRSFVSPVHLQSKFSIREWAFALGHQQEIPASERGGRGMAESEVRKIRILFASFMRAPNSF